MANTPNLELALRIKADLTEGQRALDGLSNSIQSVGETAQQQESRLQAMVAASLAQQDASESVAQAQQRTATTARALNAEWRETAAAQSAAMNAYHNKARADQTAAAAAQKAAEAIERESKELGELLGRIDPVVGKLAQLDEMEQRLRNARKAGALDATDFDHYNAKLVEQRTRLTGTSDAMKHAGISAGQYKMAMQQLPMQITDITTSLASGMPIWLVAIQQGGQIKDSFGGMGNAARALISILNPLTLAIAAATAALAGYFVAYKQGAAEAYEFEKALIMTGNAAGTSADALASMAARIDGISGTQRQAARTLAEVASTAKFTASQIELIGTTAVLMENNLSRAIGETIDDFKRLADEPAAASAELNQQYHYLTAAVYEQIAALEAQGDETAAVQLAMDTYANAMQTRSQQVVDNLTGIESAWRSIKSAAAEAWDEMLNVGREVPLEKQLEKLTNPSLGLNSGRIAGAYGMGGVSGMFGEALNQIKPYLNTLTESGRTENQQRSQALALQIQTKKEAAEAEAKQSATDEAAIAAQKALASMRDQHLSRVEQKEKAIAEYRATVEKIRAATPNSALISPEAIAKDLAAIEERYAERVKPERVKRTPTPKIDQEARAREQYLAQLERQAATFGMNAAQVREYELAEKGLTGAMRERAVAALQLLEQAEQKRQADADGKQLTALQIQLLNAQGQSAAAAAMAIEQQYGELMKRLKERGDESGLALIDSLINVEQARAQLAELQAAVDSVFAEQSRREGSIQAQQQAGLISELNARKQIVDLHAATAAEVEKLLPKMQELALITGDPAALERLKQIQAQLDQTRITANELGNALRDGFETGLAGALEGLAMGTMTLQEAAVSFVQSIAQSMAQLAAQQLAARAMDGVMGMFGGGAQAAGLTTGAAAVTASAGALSGAGATLVTGAAAIQAAAASLAAANAMSAGSGLKFASGGHVRGPGTGTSDSIPAWLSDYEFVTRSAVVRQPGALPFLDDFNRRGMAALADWAGAVRHSTGGLAGIPAPAMAAPSLSRPQLAEPAKAMSTHLDNNINLYAVQRPEDVAAMAWGKAGQEHFMVFLQQNGAQVRQLLGN